jgi:NAD(P)-dependent dehydrogenase (short-subunit alcohol dehydrogenase family)
MSIALVTGANRGLGYATVRALAKTGTCVILTGRSEARVAEAVGALKAEGLEVKGLPLDVTSPTSIAAAVQHVRSRHGHLDVLVNNAGVLPEATDAANHEFASADLFRATLPPMSSGSWPSPSRRRCGDPCLGRPFRHVRR